PILESLTSSAALFDVRVRGRRRHDDVGETLRDYHGSLYRTVRRVVFKPSLERIVRTRRQCWTFERCRQCLDAFRILGREEVAQVYYLTRSIERLRSNRLLECNVRVEAAVRPR